MKVSIIIPTLNEEKYLPKLLDSIRKQTFKEYETIVADAGSRDRTAEIARKYGARVVKGGMPAVGRNRGAEAAAGEFFFFLDADVKLPKDFLEKSYNEMQKRYLDLATCELIPLSNLMLDRILHDFTNIVVKVNQFSKPLAPGCCILVTKRLFQRVRGFDETIKMAEDHEFAQRAANISPLRVLHSTKIYLSVRRLTKEGRFDLIAKFMHSGIHQLFKGHIRDDVIEYEFGNYQRKKKLSSIEKNLIRIDRRFNRYLKEHARKKELNRKKLLEFRKQLDKNLRSLKSVFTNRNRR